MKKTAGDSTEQREAEEFLILALSKKIGAYFKKRKIPLEQGGSIEIDGYCESPLIFCEAWAHIGSPKSAQKNKVMTDAFRLLYMQTH